MNNKNIIKKIDPLFPNKCCICFVVDDRYAKHLSMALISLTRVINPNSQYDVVILCNNLSTDNIDKLSSVVKSHKNISLHFVEIKSFIDSKNLYISRHINESTYFKFAIFEILTNYHLVLYLDNDIILLKDPSVFFDIAFDQECMAVVKDIGMYAMYYSFSNELGNRIRDNLDNYVKSVDPTKYFNAGVMLINMPNYLTSKITYQDMLKFASTHDFFAHDQDVFNHFFQDKIKILSYKYNLTYATKFPQKGFFNKRLPKFMVKEINSARKDPIIVHYAGRMQPLYNNKSIKSRLYWKLVRSSPYYDELMKDASSVR